MSKNRTIPLPNALSAKQRRIVLEAAFDDPRAVALEIRSRHNKQMELWAVRGTARKLVVRLHRRFHKVFGRILALARAMLAKLVEALVPQVAAPVALLAARSVTSIDTSPLVAAAQRKAAFERAAARSNVGQDTPRSRWEKQSYELHRPGAL